MKKEMKPFDKEDWREFAGAEDHPDGRKPTICRFDFDGRQTIVVEDANGTYVRVVLVNIMLPTVEVTTDKFIAEKLLEEWPSRFLMMTKFFQKSGLVTVNSPIRKK